MVVNVNDFLLQRLDEWNIRRIYGFPGDGIKGITGAMDLTGDSLAAVRSRYEAMCAFMPTAREMIGEKS